MFDRPGADGPAYLCDDGRISGTIAKDVFAEMLAGGGRPAEIVERKGLRQLSDADELSPVVAQVLAQNPDQVKAYRGGKTALLGFFVGQVMRATRGQADPQLVYQLLKDRLD